MSGGFFRGTSAEQDTRFSNKQAKLLKTQKFAPELEHQVDMTKVKMDVMKPWIATRVTELIGFEDEVLINFIYGLLDNKVVNGKEVQISLTGFMERNTGKFMKELWSLLLSAQQNASGVPQQFLDAKEEETRKKKAETDRIANEIQKKREKERREKEQETNNKMDGDLDNKRHNDASVETLKHQPSIRSMDEKESYKRSGSRGRSRVSRSPSSSDYSRSPRSRSMSRSPQSRGRSRSISRSLPRRSPRQKHSPRHYLSPPTRRSSYSRQRSISPVHHKSPSPARRRIRSPPRRRSRSPMWRRNRSPIRGRSSSLSRSRSQSPVRRRSPLGRRCSRSPIRRRSPVSYRRRSPSPSRRRYQRSPSSSRRRSPSPVRRRSLVSSRRRYVSPVRRRSPSPQDWSPSAVRHSSPLLSRRISPRDKRTRAHSPEERISREKYSASQYSSPSEDGDRHANTYKGSHTSVRRSPGSLRSPQRDLRDRIGPHWEVSASPSSPRRSHSVSESSPIARKRSPSEERSRGSYESDLNRKDDKMIHRDGFRPLPKERHTENSDASADGVETKYSRNARDRKTSGDFSSAADKQKGSVDKGCREDESSPERTAKNRSTELRSCSDQLDSRNNVEGIKSERPGKTDVVKDLDERESGATHKGTSASNRGKKPSGEEGYRAHERSQSPPNDIKVRYLEQESLPKLARKVEQSDRSGLVDSGSEESDKRRAKSKNKGKHKRPQREEIVSDDGSSSDSHIEDRKEAKRRRKDEKRLKKEERRRRREERHRRREERRAEKRKLKSTEASIHSDIVKNDDVQSSDEEYIRKSDTRGRDIEETDSEQKKLEIALRKKALESLRAKKGIGH